MSLTFDKINLLGVWVYYKKIKTKQNFKLRKMLWLTRHNGTWFLLRFFSKNKYEVNKQNKNKRSTSPLYALHPLGGPQNLLWQTRSWWQAFACFMILNIHQWWWFTLSLSPSWDMGQIHYKISYLILNSSKYQRSCIGIILLEISRQHIDWYLKSYNGQKFRFMFCFWVVLRGSMKKKWEQSRKFTFFFF